MKKVKQAIVLVDTRGPLRFRNNTEGRYRVGAKTEKEAEELVQKAIKFGSVHFYYWDENSTDPPVKYKQVVKESWDTYLMPHSATDDHNTWDGNQYSGE